MAVVGSCSPAGYVCWLYLADDGRYKPYPPATTVYIEMSHALNRPRHQIENSDYEIEFATMTQIRKSTGNRRSVQRVPVSLPATPLMGYWEWEDSPGKFTPYGIQATVDIEQAYLARQKTVDLSITSAAIPYTIDLSSFNQTRRGFGTKRRIRRVPLPSHHSLQEYLRDGKNHTSSTNSASTFGSHSRSNVSASRGMVSTTKGSSSSGNSVTMGTSSHSVAMGTSSRYSLRSSTSTGGHPSVTPSFATPATTLISKGSRSPPRKKLPAAVVKGKAGNKPSSSSSSSSSSSRPKSSGSSPATTKTAMAGKQTKTRSRKKTEKDEIFSKYAKRVVLNFGQDEPCPICMSDLSELSGFEDDPPLAPLTSTPPGPDICKLKRCGHLLHRACLIMYMKNNTKSEYGLTCPTCKKIHGVKTGDMPSSGSMTHCIRPYSLPGHSGSNTIEITYNFSSGTQNGKSYHATGFPRVCYLPNSSKGQKVFSLLQIAWKRRLTFTVGTSVTTGSTDTIVWNEIHHKTEARGNATGHGYPDDHYLDNVLAELAAQGVEEGEGQDSSSSGEDSESDEDL